MATPVQRNGYRFGSASFVGAPRKQEDDPVHVAGTSVAHDGYELLTPRGEHVAWFADLLDACDALRRQVVGQVVRCSDRALLKSAQRVRRGR